MEGELPKARQDLPGKQGAQRSSLHGLCASADIVGNDRKKRRHGLDDDNGETAAALGENENVGGSKNDAADS